MKIINLLSSALIALAISACSSSVDMPKGTIKGYQSARMVQPAPSTLKTLTSKEKATHKAIQKAIKAQFTSHGKSFNQPNADLVVGYLVIVQDNASTTAYNEYFGYGRDADKIADIAHIKGVVKGVRPDFFERAGLLVDVIDAKTNKLIYRNIFVGDVVKNSSGAARTQRINQAVAQTLAPFFKE